MRYLLYNPCCSAACARDRVKAWLFSAGDGPRINISVEYVTDRFVAYSVSARDPVSELDEAATVLGVLVTNHDIELAVLRRLLSDVME